MPFVPKYTTEQLRSIMQSMKEYPPDQIERDYRFGKISLNDKLFMLQNYGAAQKEIAMREDAAAAGAKTAAVKELGGSGFAGPAMGEAKYYVQNVAKEFSAAWEAATREPQLSDLVKGTAQKASAGEAVFHGLMGALKVLDAYNIPGDVVERYMLEAGASPSLARAANWAVWMPTSFFGISALLKAPFKAAQKTAQAGFKAAGLVSDYASFVKNPVEYAVKQAQAQGALTATKVAKAHAENTVLKGAGVAGAATEAETKGGTQAFKTAAPEAVQGPMQQAPGMLTPQDLEKMSVTELIKHYQARSEGMIRSSTEPFNYSGVSHAQTKAAAGKSPISFDEIAARGPDAPISATELEAIGQVHGEVSKGFNAIVDEASKHLQEIRNGQRPDLVEAYKAHLAAMEVTNPAFLSGRGQAGRGLEYLKSMQDLVGESKVFDVLTRSLASEKLLDGSPQAIAYSIQKVAALGRTERAKLLEEAGKEGYQPGTLRLFFKSLLFARPGIHVGNMVGNTGSILLNGINKSVASMDPLSATTMKEAAAYWSGMWDSRTKFLEMWQKAAAKSSESLSKAGIEGTATGSMVSKGPLGWLGFEDEFMGGVVSQGLAKAKAVTEGLSKWDELKAAGLTAGQTKAKYVGNYVDTAMMDPHNYERLLGEVEQEADRILFRSPLSRAGELGAKFIRETPLDYLAPVVKFPINAMKMARDWTPGLQMLSKDFMAAVAEGGARSDAARARMTLSWMISSQVYEAAKMGYITGAGPTDQQANDVWRASGNTPYAINGVPIKWIEPFGTWFGFIADLAHASNEMTEPNLSNMFQALTMAGTRAVENNYWLRIAEGVTNSISDVTKAKDLNDVLAGVGKIILQPAKTIAGLGTIGRVGGEYVNPEMPDMKIYANELEDMKNWFMAGTIWGKDTRPKLNYSGQIRITPPIVGTEWLQQHTGLPEAAARAMTSAMSPPMRENIGDNDPVAQFMDKHGISVHDNWKYYKGSSDLESSMPINDRSPRVSLTGDQAYNWKSIALNDARQYGTNRTWNEAIQALDNDQGFLSKDRNGKESQVRQMYATFRKQGLDMLRKIDPEVKAKEAERDAIEAEQKNRPQPIGPVEEPQSTSSEQPPQFPVQFEFTKSAAQ